MLNIKYMPLKCFAMRQYMQLDHSQVVDNSLIMHVHTDVFLYYYSPGQVPDENGGGFYIDLPNGE